MDEWLAIGIWELVQDAKHNPRHMAVAQELKRLYAAAGEPATRLLAGIAAPDAAQQPDRAPAWLPNDVSIVLLDAHTEADFVLNS